MNIKSLSGRAVVLRSLPALGDSRRCRASRQSAPSKTYTRRFFHNQPDFALASSWRPVCRAICEKNSSGKRLRAWQ